MVTVWLPTASAAGDNRLVSAIERPMPPLNADERHHARKLSLLHRVTLAMNGRDWTRSQALHVSVPPSAVTLYGLVQHMAEAGAERVGPGVRRRDMFLPFYDPRADTGWSRMRLQISWLKSAHLARCPHHLRRGHGRASDSTAL